MGRFPPGERKTIMRVYIINGRNVFVKRNGSRERREENLLAKEQGETFCRRLPGGIVEMRKVGNGRDNSLCGT